MKKYLLSGLLIFIFAFISQLETSQSQSGRYPFQRVDGHNQAFPGGLSPEDSNRHQQTSNGSPFQPTNINGKCTADTYVFKEVPVNILCESGPFSLINFKEDTDTIIYACSGSFGGYSAFLCKTNIPLRRIK